MTVDEMQKAFVSYLMYQKELEVERKWFEKYPMINTGKLPREDFNDRFMPRLSEKAENYGFTIKLINMISSMDSVNENIVKLYDAYDYIRNNDPLLDSHTFSTYRKINSLCSYIIADIRRFMDDIISICWCLSQQKIVENIDIDCIGACTSEKPRYKEFEAFKPFFVLVNDLSNAYKHSSTNNMQILHGRDEPCIFALYACRNKNISQPELIGISIRELVEEFNKFYEFSFRLIEKKCAEHNEK